MERHDEFIRKAKQSVVVGEHILKVTYPLLKEGKLLLATLERVHDAHTALLQAILTFEREARTIPPFHPNFESMWNVVAMRLSEKYSKDKKVLDLFKMVEKTIKFHKEAAVAFVRKGDLILASDEYVIQKVTPEFVSDALQKTQTIITIWSRLISK